MPPETPRLRLAIGARQTRIADDSSGRRWVIGIGTQALGDGPFRNGPPTPLEMEHAIEHVENALMPLVHELPGHAARWTSHDNASWQLHALLKRPAGAPAELSIEAVEDVFNQLVAVSLGRPAGSDGLPTQADFVAHVLILREAMHHLRFVSLGLRAGPD